jgi:hypothetical protein
LPLIFIPITTALPAYIDVFVALSAIAMVMVPLALTALGQPERWFRNLPTSILLRRVEHCLDEAFADARSKSDL